MDYENGERDTDSRDVKKTDTKDDDKLDMSEVEELGESIKYDEKPGLCILWLRKLKWWNYHFPRMDTWDWQHV